jgi:hypothetical protein
VIFLFKTQIFTITGFDSFSIGSSGEGELVVGGGQQDSGFTGIPPTVEVPVDTGGGSTAPSGGGGGFSFDLDKSFFSLEVKKGIEYQEKIKITNLLNLDLPVQVSIESSQNFVFPSEENFVLGPKETREIIFSVYVSDREISDIYLGKIHFDAFGRRSVNFVLDVQDRVPLFDIKTTILNKYVFQGWKVFADLIVLNLGDLKNIDIELEYFISDFNNNTYASKKETFAIKDSSRKKIFIETPKNLEEGDYIFFSKVNYGDISASSYDTFVVRSIAYLIWLLTLLTNIFLIILVAGMIAYMIKTKGEKLKNYQRISEYG